MDDEQALDVEWLRAHPLRLRTWLAGYERGIEDGFVRGVDWSNAGWTQTTSAACRVGLQFLDAAERQRRRREPGHALRCRTGPTEARRACGGCYRPQTAEEIRLSAAESWARIEADIARREEHVLVHHDPHRLARREEDRLAGRRVAS